MERHQIQLTLMEKYREFMGDSKRLAEFYDTTPQAIGSMLGTDADLRVERAKIDGELGIVRKKRKLRGNALKAHKARKELADKIVARAHGETEEVKYGKITDKDKEKLYLLFREVYIDHGGEMKPVARELEVDLAGLCSLVGNDHKLRRIKEVALGEMNEAVEASLYRQAVGNGPPNAKFFWLKCRTPEKWNETKKIDVTARGFGVPDKDEDIPEQTVLKIVGADDTSED